MGQYSPSVKAFVVFCQFLGKILVGLITSIALLKVGVFPIVYSHHLFNLTDERGVMLHFDAIRWYFIAVAMVSSFLSSYAVVLTFMNRSQRLDIRRWSESFYMLNVMIMSVVISELLSALLFLRCSKDVIVMGHEPDDSTIVFVIVDVCCYLLVMFFECCEQHLHLWMNKLRPSHKPCSDCKPVIGQPQQSDGHAPNPILRNNNEIPGAPPLQLPQVHVRLSL